jgi:hypothetical protein
MRHHLEATATPFDCYLRYKEVMPVIDHYQPRGITGGGAL